MANTVYMKNEVTGLSKSGFYGFSWTTLFFGFLPALFRWDFKTFIGGLVIWIALAFMTAGIGALVASIAWAFMYNKYYTRNLIATGYRFADTDAVNEQAAIAIGVSFNRPQVSSAPQTLS